MTTPNKTETAPAMPGCAHTPCSLDPDTPETNAVSNAWLGNVMTPWNLARKLERERDAALKGWSDTGTEYACLRLDLEELKEAIATRINELLLVNRATGVSANEIAAAVMELIPENARAMTHGAID